MTEIALRTPRGRADAHPPARATPAGDRPLVRLAALGALGLYGVLRWETMLPTASAGRLLGLLALALALTAAGAIAAPRSRSLVAVAAVLAVLAAFAIAGVPVRWVVHLRVAVTARAIGQGLSALPGVTVPYTGVNEWIRMVIVLGAGVLLLDSALLLAFVPRALGDLRRAGAALPLVVLVAVPTALIKPRLPEFDGLVLFGLLALFLWGERIEPRHRGAAFALCAAAAIAAMIAAPALDRGKPLFDYRGLAGTLVPANVDTFNWSQGYGPINWPRRGRAVFEVQASRGDYWKAEDLDVFDGRGWTVGVVSGAQDLPAVPTRAYARWSQTIHVTIRNMRISDVIGSGVSQEPTDIPQPVVPGFGPGTWTAGTSLGPGSSYVVNVYSPHPSAAALAGAGAGYGGVTAGYRTLLLPASTQPSAAGAGQQPVVVFPAFHSRQPVLNVIGPSTETGASVVERSPYGPAYVLARRLSIAARTPYAFASSIERFLARGYTYNEDPPASAYPLESFLLSAKLGYCQQFAGAMALLLRMGGVPARVAVGFTPGRYDLATRRWVVTDTDAHAWVEAWFSGYGWVRFDPTPAADPALGAHTPQPAGAGGPSSSAAARFGRHPDIASASAPGGVRRRSRASGNAWIVGPGGAALALAVLVLIGAIVLRTRPLHGDEVLTTELERAFARTGRPLAAGVTLAALEHRLRGSPEAAAYIRTVRLERFGAATEGPSRAHRRALRVELGEGLGTLGRMRALWALPPRRRGRTASTRHPEGP